MKSAPQLNTTTASWKHAIKKVILRTGVLRLYASFFRPQEAIILCYHSIAADRKGQENCISKGITVETHLFDEQMRTLREKYNPVTLDDIADWLNGGKQLPQRSVAVTFDDGFEDNYTVAAPIMEKYNIRGTVYLAVDAVRKQQLPWYCRLHYLVHKAAETGFVLTDPDTKKIWHCDNPAEKDAAERFYARSCVVLGEEQLEQRIAQIESYFADKLDLSKHTPGMMTFEQARELRRRGHIIGLHTLSHGTAGLLTPEQLHREIGGANQILEQELGEPVQHFSYPHPYQIDPQWSEQSLAITKQIGFKTAVLTDDGVVTKASNPLLLRRVYVENDDTDAICWRLDNALAGRKE